MMGWVDSGVKQHLTYEQVARKRNYLVTYFAKNEVDAHNNRLLHTMGSRNTCCWLTVTLGILAVGMVLLIGMYDDKPEPSPVTGPPTTNNPTPALTPAPTPAPTTLAPTTAAPTTTCSAIECSTQQYCMEHNECTLTAGSKAFWKMCIPGVDGNYCCNDCESKSLSKDCHPTPSPFPELFDINNVDFFAIFPTVICEIDSDCTVRDGANCDCGGGKELKCVDKMITASGNEATIGMCACIDTFAPTSAPTGAPTRAPTHTPTEAPTHAPTHAPTGAPTLVNWNLQTGVEWTHVDNQFSFEDYVAHGECGNAAATVEHGVHCKASCAGDNAHVVATMTNTACKAFTDQEYADTTVFNTLSGNDCLQACKKNGACIAVSYDATHCRLLSKICHTWEYDEGWTTKVFSPDPVNIAYLSNDVPVVECVPGCVWDDDTAANYNDPFLVLTTGGADGRAPFTSGAVWKPGQIYENPGQDYAGHPKLVNIPKSGLAFCPLLRDDETTPFFEMRAYKMTEHGNWDESTAYDSGNLGTLAYQFDCTVHNNCGFEFSDNVGTGHHTTGLFENYKHLLESFAVIDGKNTYGYSVSSTATPVALHCNNAAIDLVNTWPGTAASFYPRCVPTTCFLGYGNDGDPLNWVEAKLYDNADFGTPATIVNDGDILDLSPFNTEPNNVIDRTGGCGVGANQKQMFPKYRFYECTRGNLRAIVAPTGYTERRTVDVLGSIPECLEADETVSNSEYCSTNTNLCTLSLFGDSQYSHVGTGTSQEIPLNYGDEVFLYCGEDYVPFIEDSNGRFSAEQSNPYNLGTYDGNKPGNLINPLNVQCLKPLGTSCDDVNECGQNELGTTVCLNENGFYSSTGQKCLVFTQEVNIDNYCLGDSTRCGLYINDNDEVLQESITLNTGDFLYLKCKDPYEPYAGGTAHSINNPKYLYDYAYGTTADPDIECLKPLGTNCGDTNECTRGGTDVLCASGSGQPNIADTKCRTKIEPETDPQLSLGDDYYCADHAENVLFDDNPTANPDTMYISGDKCYLYIELGNLCHDTTTCEQNAGPSVRCASATGDTGAPDGFKRCRILQNPTLDPYNPVVILRHDKYCQRHGDFVAIHHTFDVVNEVCYYVTPSPTPLPTPLPTNSPTLPTVGAGEICYEHYQCEDKCVDATGDETASEKRCRLPAHNILTPSNNVALTDNTFYCDDTTSFIHAPFCYLKRSTSTYYRECPNNVDSDCIDGHVCGYGNDLPDTTVCVREDGDSCTIPFPDTGDYCFTPGGCQPCRRCSFCIYSPAEESGVCQQHVNPHTQPGGFKETGVSCTTLYHSACECPRCQAVSGGFFAGICINSGNYPVGTRVGDSTCCASDYTSTWNCGNTFYCKNQCASLLEDYQFGCSSHSQCNSRNCYCTAGLCQCQLKNGEFNCPDGQAGSKNGVEVLHHSCCISGYTGSNDCGQTVYCTPKVAMCHQYDCPDIIGTTYTPINQGLICNEGVCDLADCCEL